MFQQLVEWFNTYTDPRVDGKRESVSGFGQLKLAGLKGDGQNVYAPVKPYLFTDDED